MLSLSRKVSGKDGELLAISTCIPTWLQELAKGYKEYMYTSKVISELSVGNSAQPKFQLRDGIMRYDGRIWVGSNTILQQRILQPMHYSAIRGHSSFQATYSKTKRLFAWPGMEKDV